MGKQSLYMVSIDIDVKGYGESDSWKHHFGFRKIESYIDAATGGRYGGFPCSLMLLLVEGMVVASYAVMHMSDRLFKVNGEPIFIRGGNWILSDGLLRLSKKRYHTDIKFHADMNFNMIRCWGGGLAERPEFYYYCDSYGILVWCTSSLFFFNCSLCLLLCYIFKMDLFIDLVLLSQFQ